MVLPVAQSRPNDLALVSNDCVDYLCRARWLVSYSMSASRLRPASVWLAVLTGKHSTAQYVPGRSSEECWG